jgi:hypothetical protein
VYVWYARNESSYGAVAVYIKETVHYERKTDLEINGLECVWVELKRKNKNVLYGTFHVLLSSPFQRLKFSLSHVRWLFLSNSSDMILIHRHLFHSKNIFPPPLPYVKVNIYPFPFSHFASIFFAYLWSFRWPNYIVTLPRYFSFRLPHLNINTRPPSDELEMCKWSITYSWASAFLSKIFVVHMTIKWKLKS